MSRFDRQVILRGFGEGAQKKLQGSSVLVVGAGGLGCPALIYLAAAGIGTIGIVDGDAVSISNLNRQIIFAESDVGKNKAHEAAKHLKQKYADINVVPFAEFLTSKNALNIIGKFDVVVDCCDSFSSRYLINDACVLLNKPLVFGAIYEYEGQLSVLNVPNENGIKFTYRDLFPVPPDASQIPDCNQTGVVGVLPGVIGVMQATETIKLIAGIGTGLTGKLLCYNMLEQMFYNVDLNVNRNAAVKAPVDEESFVNYDYQHSCNSLKSIPWEEAEFIYVNNSATSIFVDVRENAELPKLEAFNFIELPLSDFERNLDNLNNKNHLLLFCQTGKRSEKAAIELLKFFPDKSIYTIIGGINQKTSQIKGSTHEGKI